MRCKLARPVLAVLEKLGCVFSASTGTPPASAFVARYPQESSPKAKGAFAKFVQEDHDILLRLLRASFDPQLDLQFCYFIVTRALSRVLARFGIPLTRVGEKVSHRGTWIPFRYPVAEAEHGMRATLPGFARMLERSQAFVRYSELFGGRVDQSPTKVPWVLSYVRRVGRFAAYA